MILIINELRHEISNNVVCATSKASDQPARIAYPQSDQSLCLSLEYSMSVKAAYSVTLNIFRKILFSF